MTRLAIFHFSLLAATTMVRAGEWEKLAPLPDPVGVASPFAGVSGGALIVAGGANFPDKMPWEGGKKVWHDAVWVLEKRGGAWRSGGKLPRPLAYGVSVSMRDRIFCIGGCDADRHYAEVTHFSFADGQVQHGSGALPPLPIPLAYAASAADGSNKICVGCGSMEPGEKAASKRVFTINCQDKTPVWRELDPLPGEARILPVAAMSGADFFVCGGAALEQREGKTVRRYLRDAWRHGVRGWERLPDLPRACVAACSPAPVVEKDGASIYLIAGDDGSKVSTDPTKHTGFPSGILCYHTGTKTWSEAGETPAPRATVPCVKWGESFILPSGEVRPGVRSPEVWSFTPPDKSK